MGNPEYKCQPHSFDLTCCLLDGRSQYALLPLRSEIHHASHAKLESSLQLPFGTFANIGVGLTFRYAIGIRNNNTILFLDFLSSNEGLESNYRSPNT